MKKLKFRAYDTTRKKWLTVDEMNRHVFWDSLVAGDAYIGQLLLQGALPENVSWVQYTGLNDRDGTELYDGSIIDTPHGSAKLGWDEGNMCWVFTVRLKGLFSKTWYDTLTMRLRELNSAEVKVAGHMFENAELLGYVNPIGDLPMKELKFRAYDETRKKWHTVNEMTYHVHWNSLSDGDAVVAQLTLRD